MHTGSKRGGINNGQTDLLFVFVFVKKQTSEMIRDIMGLRGLKYLVIGLFLVKIFFMLVYHFKYLGVWQYLSEISVNAHTLKFQSVF